LDKEYDMGKMEINPDKLYEASSRLSKLGAAIQQQVTTLNEVGKGVEKGWKSSNSILFMEQIDVTKKNMDKLGSVTIDLAGKLQKIAQAAEETEKQNAALFGHGAGVAGGGSSGGGGASWASLN